MRYDFTEREVNVLKELLNLAVKAGGLAVAEAGVVLVKKLDNPIKEETPMGEKKE